MVDRVGQHFGDYRLIRLIGKGGFADVFLGEHIRRKSPAAVKVLHARLAHDNVKSFLNEARSFRLKHPHIIQILDFGLEDDFPYLVMDYAPNGSLRQRHPKGTQLPLEAIVGYVRQIAEALQYAHEEGVIHRDIKPDNMLLGEHNEVLISDFGIASIAHTSSSFSQSIRDQAGTLNYMAPEQLQGKPRPASDQYALAVVVYEWICGDRPFQGTFIEIHSQHLIAPPPSLRQRIPTLPIAVEEVVMTSLAKDPHHRFANVRAFANALAQAILSAQAPNPALNETVHLAPEPETPPAAKLIRQLPAQQSLIVPTGIMPARPVLDDNPPQPPIPHKDIQPVGANHQQVINPPTPLPPVMDYTATPSKPAQGGVPIPVASPETYTANAWIGTKPVSIPQKKSKKRLFIAVALVILVLLVIAGAILFTSGGSGATSLMSTLTITPRSKPVADNFVITAVTGTPDSKAAQVQARILTSPPSASRSATANATGSNSGQRATGTLTFLNLATVSIQIQGGTLTGADGVQVFFNGPITVPPSSISVLGTAVNVGARGNIQPLDINGTCCGNSNIHVRNIGAFSGGQDPVPNSVITKNDITTATNMLISSLEPTAQAQLQGQVKKNEQVVANTLHCTPNVTANHNPGDVARSVTVTGTVTCTEEVYDQQAAFGMVSSELTAEAAKDPGAGYVLVGNIVLGLAQPPTVDGKQTVTLVFHAAGVWAYQFTDAIKAQLAKDIANQPKDEALKHLQGVTGVLNVAISLSSGNTLPDAGHIMFVINPVPGASGSPTPTSSPTPGTTPTSAPTITPTTGLGGS